MAFDSSLVGTGLHTAAPLSLSQTTRPYQTSLKNSIHCAGVTLHQGEKVSLSLAPAPAGHGIVFHRRDLGVTLPALWSHAVESHLCTSLMDAKGAGVATIEHLMAALVGCGVDNALIELDGPEVPIMDGSSAPFVFLIECAGLVEQDAPRQVLEILKPVSVSQGDRFARLLPAEEFSISFEIDFASPVIRRQSWDGELSPSVFKRELARARTFGFMEEVEQLRAKGLARGGSLENAVVVSGDRVLNQDGLRFSNEFVRHKALDALGDLALAGAPIKGRFEASRTGHAMTLQLLRQLFADPSAYRLVGAGALAQEPQRAIA